MFSKNDENISLVGSYIFNFLIRDGFDKKLIDKRHVKFVYKGSFLEQVVDSFQSLDCISDNDKLNVMYCEYLIFLTYSKQNLNMEILSALSKLVISAEETLIKMDGEEYTMNNKIEDLEEFDSLNNKQKRDFLLVNFVKLYKRLIYKLIIKEEFFKNDELNKNMILSQLQTDHMNVVNNLFILFKTKGIINSIRNDLALTILMWNINKSLYIYNEFIIIFFF
jgi:hypothetical protein